MTVHIKILKAQEHHKETLMCQILRSSNPEVFLGKGVLEICRHLQENTHVDVQNNFIEIALRNGCSPVNLPHISRTPFTKNASGRLLLNLQDNVA